MKRALLLGILASLTLPVVPVAGKAQLNIDASMSTMRDDNLDDNALQIKDWITETSFNAGYTWETEQSNTQLFYMGGFSYFSTIVDRSFQRHAAGATHTMLFGDSLEQSVNFGATYAARVGRESFSFLDNHLLSLYVNTRHVFSEEVAGKVGYTLRSLRFSALGDFDYTEHSGFLQAAFAFPTRTTLILETNLGVKAYATPNTDSLIASRSMGRGMRKQQNASAPTVTQLTGVVRVGQSLASGTGLSLDGRYQLNLQKETRYLRSAYGNIPDDEIFDDHYGYEGPQASIMLTQLLPGAMTVRAVAGLQRRVYANLAAYDLLGNSVGPERIDSRRSLALQWEKEFEPIGLTLGIVYDYIVNASNDAFYAYTNSAMTLHLQFSY